MSQLKERYDFACAECGHEMQFAPSVAMRMGQNNGHASCSKCKTFLYLEIAPDQERGSSKRWDDFLKEEGLNA